MLKKRPYFICSGIIIFVLVLLNSCDILGTNYSSTDFITREELDQLIAEGEDVTSINTSEITDMSSLFEDNPTFN